MNSPTHTSSITTGSTTPSGDTATIVTTRRTPSRPKSCATRVTTTTTLTFDQPASVRPNPARNESSPSSPGFTESSSLRSIRRTTFTFTRRSGISAKTTCGPRSPTSTTSLLAVRSIAIASTPDHTFPSNSTDSGPSTSITFPFTHAQNASPKAAVSRPASHPHPYQSTHSPAPAHPHTAGGTSPPAHQTTTHRHQPQMRWQH